MNVLAIAESLTETQLKQFKANVLLGANSWNPYADRVGSKIFQIWLFDHYSLFRSRKPSKTSLQRESLTIETNDIIGDHQVSDHYTANSTVCFANFSQVLPPNSSAQIAAFSMSSVIDNQRKSSGYFRLAALVHRKFWVWNPAVLGWLYV